MSDLELLARLREILGEESLGRLLEAAKITGREPIQALRQAVEAYSTLLVQEQAGWAVELVRDTDTRTFSLE